MLFQTIYIGCHTGEVVMIQFGDECQARTEGRVRLHCHPITTITARGETLISGDSGGNIHISKVKDGSEKMCTIDSYG